MKELNSNHGKYEFFSGQNFRKMENLAQFRRVIRGDVFWIKLQANSEMSFTMYVTPINQQNHSISRKNIATNFP